MLRNLVRTFEDIQMDIKESKNYFSDIWNNNDNNEPANVLVDLLVANSYTLNFYLDRYLKNSFLLADELRPAQNLMATMGYGVKGVCSSRAKVRLEWIEGSIEVNCEIPEDMYLIYTENESSYTYISVDRNILQAGGVYVDIDLMQGELDSVNVTGSEVSNTGRVGLGNGNIDTSYLRVDINDVRWELVDSLIYKERLGKYYSFETDIDGNNYIVLSKDYLNYVNKDSSVYIRFVISYGYLGSIDNSGSWSLGDSLQDDNGVDISENVRVYSIGSIFGGEDSENFVESRENVAELVGTMGKAITSEDYEILCSNVRGVATCKIYDWNNIDFDVKIDNPYEMKIAIAPIGGGEPSSLLKESILSLIAECGWIKNVVVVEPNYRVLNLRMGIGIGDYKGTVEERDIYFNISSTLMDFFSVGKIGFGSTLNADSILEAIYNCDDRITFAYLSNFHDIVFGPLDIPILGNLLIEFNYFYIPNFELGNFSEALKSVMSRWCTDFGTSKEGMKINASFVPLDSGVILEKSQVSLDVDEFGMGTDTSKRNILSITNDLGDSVDSINTLGIRMSKVDSGNASDVISIFDRVGNKEAISSIDVKNLVVGRGNIEDLTAIEGKTLDVSINTGDTASFNEFIDILSVRGSGDIVTAYDSMLTKQDMNKFDVGVVSELINNMGVVINTTDAGIIQDIAELDVSRLLSDIANSSDVKVSIINTIFINDDGVGVEEKVLMISVNDSGVGADINASYIYDMAICDVSTYA